MTQETERYTVLIGNAPTRGSARGGAASRLAEAEAVVRINAAEGFGGRHGTRTTHLFLVNCGGSMAERLSDPGFAGTPVISAAGEVILPIAPETDDLRDPPVPVAERAAPDARNYAAEATRRLQAAGKAVRVLPASVFTASVTAAGHDRFTPDTPPPSTGLIALVWLLDAFPDCRVHAFGFGFEGWSGHAWDGERAFFARQEALGRVVLHPPA